MLVTEGINVQEIYTSLQIINKLRDELLNQGILKILKEAKTIIG